MSAIHLKKRTVAKPWGVSELPKPFHNCHEQGSDEKIGEIWFETPPHEAAELLVKYIFTSEALSVQVHPDDGYARNIGHRTGKAECWYILDCIPGAVVGVGLSEALDQPELLAAIQDGSIEKHLRWHPVKAGDFMYIAPGTIHAIGAGISLVELQQNVDITYRLYDYGRPRPLHLDEGLAVLCPHQQVEVHNLITATGGHLIDDAHSPLQVEFIKARPDEVLELGDERPKWFVPLSGEGSIDDHVFQAGECWKIDGQSSLRFKNGGRALLGWSA